MVAAVWILYKRNYVNSYRFPRQHKVRDIELRTALDQHEISRLRDEQTLVPVVLGEEEKLIEEIISALLIRNSEGTNIPLTTLVNLEREISYSTISA